MEHVVTVGGVVTVVLIVVGLCVVLGIGAVVLSFLGNAFNH